MFSLKAGVRGATVAASLAECIKWCVCVCLSERRRGLGKMLGCYDDGGGGQDDLILNCVSTAVTDAH